MAYLLECLWVSLMQPTGECVESLMYISPVKTGNVQTNAKLHKQIHTQSLFLFPTHTTILLRRGPWVTMHFCFLCTDKYIIDQSIERFVFVCKRSIFFSSLEWVFKKETLLKGSCKMWYETCVGRANNSVLFDVFVFLNINPKRSGREKMLRNVISKPDSTSLTFSTLLSPLRSGERAGFFLRWHLRNENTSFKRIKKKTLWCQRATKADLKPKNSDRQLFFSVSAN